MKTDRQLQQDVTAELKWEPSIHAERIGVEVKNGVVTLAGQVDSFAEKWNAEHAAQRVSGVMALSTELKVQLQGLAERSDADIARSAENVLSWISTLPADGVKVLVERGWLTLSGTVEWQFQRQAATDAVRHLLGVTGVSNQIAIQPTLSATAVKSDIEAALKRSAAADAKDISVAVDDTDLTLSGHVHTWAERETALHTAWGTPGVRNVVDRMELVY